MKYVIASAIICLILLSQSSFAVSNQFTQPLRAEAGFTFVQLHYSGGNWNPHPNAWSEIYHFITTTTSINANFDRKEITSIDESIASYPFIYITGTTEFLPFTSVEITNLQRFLEGGGILFVDDCVGIENMGFTKSMKKELARIFPDKKLEKIEKDNALFFSFYLLPEVSGCRIAKKYMEGIKINNQIGVLYSYNDLFGIWERDKLGNWLFQCVPNGENQRLQAMKLTVNIIMYALTGTYKLDAIHSPFIKEKLKKIERP